VHHFLLPGRLLRDDLLDTRVQLLEKPRNTDEQSRFDTPDVVHHLARVSHVIGLRATTDRAQIDHSLEEIR